MTIEILAYSGRPDPVIAVEDAAAGELETRLAQLVPSPRGFAPADRLGYRGLRVRSGAVEIEVSDGHVRVSGTDGRATDLDDAGRGLERWLLERARAAGGADDHALVEAILREVERP